MEREITTCLEEKRYPEAFELLISHYQNRVFRLAYSMLGNKALAQETAQDVFIRIWKALSGYRGQASLSTWIYTITRNTCLTAIKKNPSKKEISIEEPGTRQATRTWHAAAPPRSGRIDLTLLISQLPERYRQVVQLYYMEERSYQEVSRLLDLPMGTVKTYLHRARKDLATAIMQDKAVKGER